MMIEVACDPRKWENTASICLCARDLVSAGFISSYDLYQTKKTALRLTTGSRAIDTMLGGGVETQCGDRFIANSVSNEGLS